MPTARSLVAALALAFTAISCSDKGPTTPTNEAPSLAPSQPTATGPLVTTLTNFAVTDPTTGATGLFNGTLTITSFATNTAGDLLANGTLVGTITGGITRTVNETFTGLLVTPSGQRCTILHLDVGPIFLDLLGLQVSTNEIILDITAQAGPGNLLGNLLCALVHILDQNPLAALVGNLLAQINAILAG
jgi:hypothetical protein